MSDIDAADGQTTQERVVPPSETPEDAPADEYAHLRTKRAEREGNTERATVREVFVGTDTVTLTLSFEWTDDTERVRYDLEEDRQLLQLESLAEANDLTFEQVPHLEGTRIDVTYVGDRWVPTVHADAVEGYGSIGETFRTELRLLARELARSPRLLRGALRGVRSLSTKQVVVGVVVFKKIAIVALLAYLLL